MRYSSTYQIIYITCNYLYKFNIFR